jgi:hypothetical protein
MTLNIRQMRQVGPWKLRALKDRGTLKDASVADFHHPYRTGLKLPESLFNKSS